MRRHYDATCQVGHHCSVFCSSILILNNFYSFNLSIFCHYSLQFLYIALSLSYLTNIFLPLLKFLIWCSDEPHSYHFDGCVICLCLLSASFSCSLFALITYFYFYFYVNWFKVTLLFFQFCLVFFYGFNLFSLLSISALNHSCFPFLSLFIYSFGNIFL